MVLSDAKLARMAQGGDAASLGILLERYRAPLYALALRILGCRPEAQDAVQDTFLIALRKIGQLRDPEAGGGWLYTILRSVCLTRLRKDQGEILFGELPLVQEQSTTEPSAEESIDRLAMGEWVWTALSKLPEALRVTAMLRYFGSHASYEELSAILGVPVGTVRSRLNRVKIKLADALLETAGLAHDEARRLREDRARYFGAAAEEMNRGEGYDLLAGIHSDDSTVVLPGGRTFLGRTVMAEDLESDLHAHTKMHPTNII